MEDTDKYVVERDGVLMNVERQNVKHIAPDDLFLVNRGGVDYSITGAIFLEEGGGGEAAPFISNVLIAETETTEPRFTNQNISVEGYLLEPANPPETWGFKVRFDGELQDLLKSSLITDVDLSTDVITFENNNDLDQFVEDTDVWMYPDYLATTSEVTGVTQTPYFTAATYDNGFMRGTSANTRFTTCTEGIIEYVMCAQEKVKKTIDVYRTVKETLSKDSVWEKIASINTGDDRCGLNYLLVNKEGDLYISIYGWSNHDNVGGWRVVIWKSTDGGFTWNITKDKQNSDPEQGVSLNIVDNKGLWVARQSAYGSSGWPPATGNHISDQDFKDKYAPSYDSGINGCDQISQNGQYLWGFDGYEFRRRNRYWYKTSVTQTGSGTLVEIPSGLMVQGRGSDSGMFIFKNDSNDWYSHNFATGEKSSGPFATEEDLATMRGGGENGSVSSIYAVGDYFYLINNNRGWWVVDKTATLLAWVPYSDSITGMQQLLQGPTSEEMVETLGNGNTSKNFLTFIKGSAIQLADSSELEKMKPGFKYTTSSGAEGSIVSVDVENSILNTDTPVPIGDTIQVVVTATAKVQALDVANSKLQIKNITGTWVAGQTMQAGIPVDKSRMWGVLSTNSNVISLTDLEPDFTTLPGNTYWTIQFPQVFPSGNDPDTDLPPGTSMTVLATAVNEKGSSYRTSNVLVPGNLRLINGDADDEAAYNEINQAFTNYTTEVMSRQSKLQSSLKAANISEDDLRFYLNEEQGK